MVDASNMYAKDDAAMASGIAAMEQHVESMMRAGNVAERINEEIAAGYIAGSSTVFQSKVQDWVDQYRAIMQSFQQLAENSTTVNTIINQAEQDTQMLGGNW